MLPVADAKRGSGSGIAVLPTPLVSVVLWFGVLVVVTFSVITGGGVVDCTSFQLCCGGACCCTCGEYAAGFDEYTKVSLVPCNWS